MSQTELEKNLEAIIRIFHKYTIQTKPYDMLSRAELNKLMKEQLPNFMQGSKDAGAVDRLFKELDQNKDAEVSFEEFMGFVSKVLIYSHDKFHHGH
uniref:EF-hand domain-containing protein n=1 Tax=Laticauda laticaudata TaxID=8630 RepID=A0A8C5WYP0_LATLA